MAFAAPHTAVHAPSSARDSAIGVYPAPSLTLLGLEPVRAALEYLGARLMDRSSLPAGDGHPVVLFPGLAADKTCLGPLRTLCDDLGYVAYDWGRGFNTGPQGDVDDWIAELGSHVQSVACLHESKVSLIGWSLGGIYAREIARLLPETVRQVITLGTPFAGGAEATHAGWVYRLLSGQPARLDEDLARRLRSTPPGPTTSIFSRSDGVVAWQACQEQRELPHAESVEVEGSHVGMVWHPKAWAVVADRLSQPDGGWRPYRDPSLAANDTRVVLDETAGLAALATAKVSAKVGRLAA